MSEAGAGPLPFLTWTPSRAPGARLAVSDLGVIAGGVAATLWLRGLVPELAWLPAFVLGHFFLFCNLVRLRTRRELTWCAVFVANFLGHVALGRLEGASVLAWQAPLTLALVGLEVRSPGYRGIFCDRLRDTPRELTASPPTH